MPRSGPGSGSAWWPPSPRRSARMARTASSSGSSRATSQARAFYEKLGAELLIEQPFTWDGMELVEVGYGWRNLDSLVAAVDLPAMLH
jgi:hypothetical protein